jgi:lysophospholipase L1-like esterase
MAVACALLLIATVRAAAPPKFATTAEEDHQRMLAQLKIDQLRPGPSGNPSAPNAANADESKANKYPNLPDPLLTDDGRQITTPQQWWDQRRPELVELFDREIYGRVPKDVPGVRWEVTATRHESQHGVAVVMKELRGRVDNSRDPQVTVDIEMTLVTPEKTSGPVPVVMEFTFPRRFMTSRPGGRAPMSRPAEAGPPWQQQVLERGWGYALLVPTSVQADTGAGLLQGIIGLCNHGQPRKPDDWGALRAWAWGASRALDYLETDRAVDARRVAIEGLSRYGKAALVTMAYEPRFAIGFIASSGAGGAKLLRRDFGEQVENLASSAEYHWFAGNFLKYAGPLTPGDLPVDAHELIALCAPRPLFISAGSPAVEGNWIDARGSFLAAVAAAPVYRLLGRKDLGATEMPTIETALVSGDLAFRQHAGGHTAGPNWPTFLDFAARYFGSAQATTTTTRPRMQASTDDFGIDGPGDVPTPRPRDPVWVAKHEELLAKARQGRIDLYFLGDSITRRWEATHRENWDHNFAGWRTGNFGAGGDRTQNVLWRLGNGELAGANPKVIVLMIGTNNVGLAKPQDVNGELVDDTVRGITAVVRALRDGAPDAKILLTGITPRNPEKDVELMPTINAINDRIARLADEKHVRFLNVNPKMAGPDGHPRPGVTEDGLHLSNEGYQIWADAMRPILVGWLGERPATARSAETTGAGAR